MGSEAITQDVELAFFANAIRLIVWRGKNEGGVFSPWKARGTRACDGRPPVLAGRRPRAGR